MSEDLPEGWANTRLGNAASVDLGKMLDRAKRTKGTALPYLRNASVRWGAFDLSNLLEMPFEDNELERYSLKQGDLLMCEGGEPGRAAIWPNSGTPIKYQKTLLRVRPSAGVESSWIMYCLKASALRGDLEKYFTGSTIKHFPRESVLVYEFPIAPIVEQRQIIAKVEALMAEVSATRTRLAKVSLILKRFRQSVLTAAFSGKLTEDWRSGTHVKLVDISLALPEAAVSDVDESLPDEWLWISLSAVATRVTDGTHQPPPLVDKGIPFLLIGNIVRGHVDWTKISKWVSRETYEVLTARCRPELGDVLYTAVGATFGQAIEVDWSTEFIFQRHIAHIKPISRLIKARYLTLWFNSPSSFARAKAVARGAAQPSVALGDLKKFPVPLCSMEEQDEIVRRVDALFALADSIERRLAVAIARTDKIPQAILAKAFRGELVPTEAELARAEGRDYEPASALLERIRKEREATAPSSGRGARRPRPRPAL